jgi:hypothetical protein
MIQGGNRMVFALEGTMGVVIIPKMFSDKSQVQEIVFFTLISREGKNPAPIVQKGGNLGKVPDLALAGLHRFCLDFFLIEWH